MFTLDPLETMADSSTQANWEMTEVAEPLRQAIVHHQHGQLKDAETLYRHVLAVRPDNFDALHFCGVLLYQRGDYPGALGLIERALKSNDRSAQAHSSLGVVLAMLEKHTDALASYDRAIALKPDFAEAFNYRGNSLRALKRPHEAAASFERALSIRPDYAEAHNNRGNVLFEFGRADEALASYDRAVALQPLLADGWINRANLLRRFGRHEDALAALECVLKFRPSHSETHLALGHILFDLKRFPGALQSYDRAAVLRPNATEPLFNCGRTLCELKRFEESIASYDRALTMRPDDCLCLVGRGNTRHAMGNYVDAISDYDRAITIRPDFAEAHGKRGNALREIGKPEQALASFDCALALKPDYDEARNNRGNALIDLNRPAEALAEYERALAIAPGNTYAWTNRGNALAYLTRTEEAIASFDRAIELDPQLVEAHWNRSLAYLLDGNFIRGWPGYEWRWRREGETIPRDFVQPQWRGEDLRTKTILLHAEQGFGDSIQFVRYLPMVAQRGARIVLELPDILTPLIERNDSIIAIRRRGEVLPPFDLHCPLLSLPLAFGTTLETIPSAVPYLRIPEDRTGRWRSRFALSARPRVGLAWSGKSSHKNNHNRSIPLSRLQPLLSVPGVEFFSLQREYRDDELSALSNLPLHRLDDAFLDFADTAAAIAELDLVIAVDTAVAHLAGAIAKPLWLLLSHIQDWRWLRGRDDSPWYPTARLFRQPDDGRWDEVIARVAQELSVFAASYNGATK